MHRYCLSRTILVLLSLILVGCQLPSVGARVTPTGLDSQTPPALQPTETDVATASPQRVILVAPEETDGFLLAELSREIAELSEQAGMLFEQRPGISSQEVPSDTRLLVAFAADPGMADLAQGHPDVQFLAIGIPGMPSASNLSVLGPEGIPYDRQAFVAGFIAAMVGDDWRVGSLTVVDRSGGLAAQNGFLQGARFLCGQCRSAYPPYMELPTFVSLTSSDSDWSAAIETFRQSRIALAYVFPTPESEVILQNLELSGMLLIGSQPRPLTLLPDRWIATVRSDPASGLRGLWEDLLVGKGGLIADLPLVIEEINQNLLSPGRLRLAQGLIEDVLAGRVDTAVDPLTGQPR